MTTPSLANDAGQDWIRDGSIIGDVRVEGHELHITGTTASLVIGDAARADYQVTVQARLSPEGSPFSIAALPADAGSEQSPAALRMRGDRVGAGESLIMTSMEHDGRQWRGNRQKRVRLNFLPTDPAARKRVEADAIQTRPWTDRWIELRVRIVGRSVSIWTEGLLMDVVKLDRPAAGQTVLSFQTGDRLRHLVVEPMSPDERYVMVDLTHQARGHDGPELQSPQPARRIEGKSVPFILPRGNVGSLDLSHAKWIDQDRDPWSFQEPYDGGPDVVHDRRMPMLRIPSADYVAAHVLAVVDDKPSHTNTFSLRAGRFGLRDQVVHYDFHGEVPRTAEDHVDAPWVDTPVGRMRSVRVPITAAFAQDIANYVEIELTREVRLARRHPDPNRFRYRPVGMPSGVRIAAITLERSPLAFRVTSDQTAHAFVEPDRPTFHLHLNNITSRPQAYSLRVEGESLTGLAFPTAHFQGVVPAQESTTIPVSLEPQRYGYHELRAVLGDGNGRDLLTRRTSFALLPPDTRQHRDTSPFGMWDFGDGHFGVLNADIIGPLYVKLGMRYGMFRYSVEERSRWGVRQGQDYAVRMKRSKGPSPVEGFLARRQLHPDGSPLLMLFHEDPISRDHVTRNLDLVHDYPPYVLSDEERQRLDAMMTLATETAQAIRKHDPSVHITLGNGAIPTREELYRHKFPPALFDSAGNESGSYGRLPETQPPDNVAFNASVWMDRQLLDHYGYADKPVTLAYEIGYPNSNPGNLTPQTQADYYVRHALHMLAWRMPLIRLGLVHDVGNSYRFSNWGSAGFARMAPELNVKPAFIAYATMTRVLDGATFQSVKPTDSQGVYVLSFDRPDHRKVLAMWTIRGERPVTLAFEGDELRTVVDSQGNTLDFPQSQQVQAMLSASPVYVVGSSEVVKIELGVPTYQDAPRGHATVLDTLGSMAGWTVQTERDSILEFYNPLMPRRLGQFVFEPAASWEGCEQVLKVSPQPIHEGKPTMPMYMALRHGEGLTVPGRPTQVGVWVNGNAGWGRIIFEFVDASGQTWTSIGAPSPDAPPRWLEQRTTPQQREALSPAWHSDWNTDDLFGHSRINFDGWRYVAMDMPGHYPGEGYRWPGTSQWRHDRDGTVHYPLTFRRLVVELNERVLHVADYQPVRRPEIYLRDLTVAEHDINQRKQSPWDW